MASARASFHDNFKGLLGSGGQLVTTLAGHLSGVEVGKRFEPRFGARRGCSSLGSVVRASWRAVGALDMPKDVGW